MEDKLAGAGKEVFVRLYEDGLIYRGKYIVNWCPDCGTAISDLEVKHEDVAGKLYEIRYPVIGGVSGRDEFITVATTRRRRCWATRREPRIRRTTATRMCRASMVCCR